MVSIKSFVARASAGVRSDILSLSNECKMLLPDGATLRSAKYEILTTDKHSVAIGDTRYYRIRALRRIERPFGLPPVEPGDLGGYVTFDTGNSLSNEGDCWVADEAFVSGYVSGDSQVTGHAHVGYPSTVSGKSLISDFAQVIDGAHVDESLVTGFAQVVGRNFEGLYLEEPSLELLGEQTQVVNHSWVSGRARVSDGAYVHRFSSIKGSSVVSGPIFLTNGSSVAGVVLTSECDMVLIRGEFIDEPMNMWGCPKGIVVHEGDGKIETLQALGDIDRGAVLPYFGGDYLRCARTPKEIGKIYGIEELEFHDTGNGTWASSFDKSIEAPRKILVSSATGIEYFEPASKEEKAEYRDKMVEKAESMREVLKGQRDIRDTIQSDERAAWHAEHPEE
jgi:hypothetical protein